MPGRHRTADERAKATAIGFALAGLYLHVERGFTGRQVQHVHTLMARRRRAWPSFVLPRDRGRVNVEHVMTRPPGPARDRAIEAWCASVWGAFGGNRDAVVGLLESCGIG
ncbi:hypothetical protein RxyAA322_27590 [Rubrobacter xylanophilus]|uniref:Uncharacterized protein n=1 Tax=Rubrobacter xylanophilus TaxID=49319 RepID=A0A510HNC0_9ACTN|nr:DUF5946 family protein [Rubrobacter xylanophilus]BBL80905.1 hypothetical protein RxyAA322_27590 [Rubrobacter xylanophilus]